MSAPGAITLVIPNLTGGGAERVMANMARWWAGRGTAVTLVTFSAEPTAYDVHPAVRRIFLDAISAENPPELPEWPAEAVNVARLRAALAQTPARAPIISFLPRMNMRTLLAARDLERRVVVCERTWPPMCPLGETGETLRRALYPTAACVAVQTRRCADDWATVFVPPDRVRVIPNALPTPLFPRDSWQDPSLPRRFLMAAGRLELEKNFSTLIDVFAKCASTFADLHLVILGEGSQRPDLKSRITAQGLAGRVHLPGFVPDIAPYCRHASAFVLPSFFEGFPCVLLEAMAEGCPVVAFDCLTGPAEIIRHGIDGLLAPPGDTAALGAALARLLRDNAFRDSLARRAGEVRERFAEDSIMEQWNKVAVR